MEEHIISPDESKQSLQSKVEDIVGEKVAFVEDKGDKIAYGRINHTGGHEVVALPNGQQVPIVISRRERRKMLRDAKKGIIKVPKKK